MWRSDRTAPDIEGKWSDSDSETPPKGLAPAGEGFDPGLFDVDPLTGTVSALPRRNGNYTLYLIAVDTAGRAVKFNLPAELDQVVVKRWSFTVVGKPDFVVTSFSRVQDGLPAISSGEEPFITAAKIGVLNCTVGTMYHIAPIDPTTLQHRFASGGADARIRFTIRNPLGGFFVDPSTGEVQGNPLPISPGTSTTYVSDLLAVDPGGQEAVLERMTFHILPRPLFIPVFTGARAPSSSDAGYTDPSMQAQIKEPLVVGSSYRFATLQLDERKTSVSAGKISDITYTLSPDAPDSFFVNSRSGDIFGTLSTAGNYTFDVLAVDQAGKTVVVERLRLNVLERPTFTIAVKATRVSDAAMFSVPNKSTFIANDSYKFSPFELVEAKTTVSAGEFADVTYTLESSSDGWFVSAQTGEVFGTFDSVGEHNLTLYAVDHAGKQAVVEAMTFEVQPRPKFRIVVGKGRVQSGSEYTDLSLPNLAMFPHESYKFSPRVLDANRTTVSSGDFSDITYTLVAGDGWFVNALSGEIFGQFHKVGVAFLSLYAVDASGVQLLVEEFRFDVQPRPIFVIGFAANCEANERSRGPAEDGSSESGSGSEKSDDVRLADHSIATRGLCRSNADEEGYTNPKATAKYVVRTSYKIAPLVLDANSTTLSDGQLSDITYTLSQSAPDSFFVQARSGVIFGTFDHPGIYNFSLVAVDKAGQTSEVEQYTFNVVNPDQFILGFASTTARAAHGPQFADPTASRTIFYANDSYKIAPLVVDSNTTEVSSGTFDDVTFTLSADAPDSFFVQAATGVIFGTFERMGVVEFSLLAVDGGGQTATVENYTFRVVERGQFGVLEYSRSPSVLKALNSTKYTDPSTTEYALFDTYRFASLEVMNVSNTDDAPDSLGFTIDGAPPGFLIDPADGYIQGTPTTEGNYTMSLFAVDSRNNRAKIEDILLVIRPKDTDVSSYGPNGNGCNDGVLVDIVSFDKNFTCDCSSTRFLGENCAVEVAASTASAAPPSNTPVVSGSLAGAMLLFVLIGIAVYRRRLYTLKMKAFDFEAEIARLVHAGEIDEIEGASRIPREIKRSHIVMTQQIGEGAFGEVRTFLYDR